jgi:gamma-glutamyltranspeptidase/glutathione hydrolase
VRRLLAAMLFAIAAPALAGSQVTVSKAALSTAHPGATQVGLSVLKRGGSAADAAVAVALTLAVVHPQAGNLGGGGFLVYYDASTKGVWTLDFTEVAPLAASRGMFASDANASRTGGLAVAVPGTVAGLEALHKKFGVRPWKELFEPAIRIAQEGFRVDAELAGDVAAHPRMMQFAGTAALYFPNNKPIAAGATLAQPDLAATLQRLGETGARDFYDGEIAKKLVESLRAHGGHLGFRDLREYEPVWRAPIKLKYRDYDIYTVPPPSGGGLVIGEALNILSGYDLRAAGFQTPKALHLLVEAQRRAYLDRNKYVGDPVSTRIPYRELLSADRATQWRKTIDVERSTATLSLAEPGSTPPALGEHTTHFSIADADGNIALVTTSLGENFGSGIVLPGLGFFLNAAMDDFTSFANRPNRDGLVQSAVNAVEPSKRIASSLSPTLVLRGGKPWLALGTRGGPSIPTSILQVFLNLVVYGKSLQEAVAAPRWHHQALPEDLEYEEGRGPAATVNALNAMGHPVRARGPIGDVHALLFQNGKITAVADPRRGGVAGGY